MKRTLSLGLAAALMLSACNSKSDDAPAANQSAGTDGETLAGVLATNKKLGEAFEATGMEPTLSAKVPYTLLAPSDAAFDKLPAGALDTLMKPEGRSELAAILSHHLLPGTVLAADIGKAIDAGGGKALIATMGGGTLTAVREGDRIVFTDAAGTRAVVTEADQKRSNGVVHQVDSVLMPTR